MDIYIKGKDHIVSTCIDGEVSRHRCNSLSNNQLEWESLVNAMKIISGTWNQSDTYNVFTDSVLLYRQILGDYRIKSKTLKPIYFKWNSYKNILMDFDINYFFVSGYDNQARTDYESNN